MYLLEEIKHLQFDIATALKLKYMNLAYNGSSNFQKLGQGMQ